MAQDLAASEHSGGVVWETALFLLRFLERQVVPSLPLGCRVVELGAGCGLLGLGLHRLGCQVVLTDQPVALPNLRRNAAQEEVQVLLLTWGEDVTPLLRQGPYHLVVASDVVFATRLVRPLLETIHALAQGSAWLCVQKRDPDAHALFMATAPELFEVEECSFEGLEGLEAACKLDCLLLHLTPRRKGPAQGKSVGAVRLSDCLGGQSLALREWRWGSVDVW